MKYLKYVVILVVLVFAGLLLNYHLNPNSKKYAGIQYVYDGSSLAEFGFDISDHPVIDSKHLLYPLKTCNIGDFCAFQCLMDKCNNPYFDSNAFIKKVIDKNGDCYWFQGNTNPVTRPDGKQYESWDSRKYGWLCGNDLKIDGVVK